MALRNLVAVTEQIGDQGWRYFGDEVLVNSISGTRHWGQRALLLPHLSARGERYLRDYNANKNVGSARGRSPTTGGPVLAVDATLKILNLGLSLANGQLFGVATVHPRDVAGWAAATKVLDLATGERHPACRPRSSRPRSDFRRRFLLGYFGQVV
jgi:hypothetical protein